MRKLSNALFVEINPALGVVLLLAALLAFWWVTKAPPADYFSRDTLPGGASPVPVAHQDGASPRPAPKAGPASHPAQVPAVCLPIVPAPAVEPPMPPCDLALLLLEQESGPSTNPFCITRAAWDEGCETLGVTWPYADRGDIDKSIYVIYGYCLRYEASTDIERIVLFHCGPKPLNYLRRVLARVAEEK